MKQDSRNSRFLLSIVVLLLVIGFTFVNGTAESNARFWLEPEAGQTVSTGGTATFRLVNGSSSEYRANA
ncbi:hypothetical protein AGMMS50276_31960 [Synergistales bacterium]|nr:hypothetical protein AGMMS50276_31960 [Synergistales bacterium]